MRDFFGGITILIGWNAFILCLFLSLRASTSESAAGDYFCGSVVLAASSTSYIVMGFKYVPSRKCIAFF